MNEKIKELMLRAGTDTSGKWMSVDNAEKFAELIVKECAGIYSKIDNGNAHLGTEDYLEALQKHFGVEL